MIIVLNKCDLVELEVVRGWQQYLEAQKVAIKVVTMQHKQVHPKPSGIWRSLDLESYLYNQHKAKCVGVVGMANTGKKTLIKGL